jgi:hypothetical protein
MPLQQNVIEPLKLSRMKKEQASIWVLTKKASIWVEGNTFNGSCATRSKEVAQFRNSYFALRLLLIMPFLKVSIKTMILSSLWFMIEWILFSHRHKSTSGSRLMTLSFCKSCQSTSLDVNVAQFFFFIFVSFMLVLHFITRSMWFDLSSSRRDRFLFREVPASMI